MLAINHLPRRKFFNFFRNLFGKGSEIKKAYTQKDYKALKATLEESDHWAFLNYTINGNSILHDAIENNDMKILEIVDGLEYKGEVLNNQK